MRSNYLKKALRFCCIVDETSSAMPLAVQVETAMLAGARMIRYASRFFSSERFLELQTICHLCKSNCIPFVVQDHLLLAKALNADGLHLDKTQESIESVRNILGSEAIIGKTIPVQELSASNTSSCDYFELTPFEPESLKDPVPGLMTSGLASDPQEAERLLGRGAIGITASSFVFKSENPASILRGMAECCNCPPRSELAGPWEDEFGLIEKLLESGKNSGETTSSVIVPPGDDACLLAGLSRPVISTDTQKEGVHFRLDWQTPEEIGLKAVSITLSDLAASYARPVSLFINLGIPPDISETFVENIYQGVRTALGAYECSLGGGNVSSGKVLSLDLFAIGQGRKDIFPKRSKAQPGYDLYVTGPLGLARAGLEALKKNDGDFPGLVRRFKRPRARFDAAEILAAGGVECVMDISDGLSGDAGHMAKASSVTIELDMSTLPNEKSLLSFCEKYNYMPEEFALAGGEDYELLFACPPETFLKIKSALPESMQVGRCVPFQGRHVIHPKIGISSYRHGT